MAQRPRQRHHPDFLDTEGASVALADLGWDAKPPSVPPELVARLQSGTDPQLQETETFSEVLAAFGALTRRRWRPTTS